MRDSPKGYFLEEEEEDEHVRKAQNKEFLKLRSLVIGTQEKVLVNVQYIL
jgi:hypothetical protein